MEGRVRTEIEFVGDLAAAGGVVWGSDSAPYGPTPQFIERGAIFLFDVAPLEERRVDSSRETRNVEHVAKGRKSAVMIDVRRCKRRYNRDARREETEVYHINVGHKVVCPSASDPSRHIVRVFTQVVYGMCE